MEQLGSLLLPIDALLSHRDFHPEADAPAGVVTLFRNMWLLCTLFRFPVDDKNHSALEWQRPALARIAMKTPALVMEANDTIVSDLEYNTVIRQEYVEIVSPALLARLYTHTFIIAVAGHGDSSHAHIETDPSAA